MNINGADGLVHLSEISWDRIRHPGDELKVGQEVEVQVISIDEDKRHIGLSIRRLKDDPWQEQIKNLKVGQLVEAKITRLTKFGAFAMLESGIEGLVHISEISDEHIAHPKEVLHEDDQVTLRIIKIEPESHRIGLSLRRVESLAFADMDMKVLQKELEDTDIQVAAEEKAEEKDQAETPADQPEEEAEKIDQAEIPADQLEEAEKKDQAETPADQPEEETEKKDQAETPADQPEEEEKAEENPSEDAADSEAENS